MPGLPNYRRLLGPKNLVEDREIADEYGRSPFTYSLISGDGAFGTITEATTEGFLIEFAPPVGEVGVSAVEQFTAVLGIYTGDAGAFRATSLAGNPIDRELGDGAVFLTPITVRSFGDPQDTMEIEALAADNGVERTGTLSFYTRILSVGEFGPVLDPDSLVLTIPLSKTYNPA